jgi:hypothetical protein
MTTGQIDRKLRAQLLLARRVENDRLMLADDVLRAALDGSRTLTGAERAVLDASPLTLRRFRMLALEQRRAVDTWRGSGGMLRAASGGQPLAALSTDDGHWTLHFVQQDGHWRVILALAASSPFAPRLVREQPMLRVLDGAGAIILLGSLDADGECETAWPFESAPEFHFHQAGARFAVEPVHP